MASGSQEIEAMPSPSDQTRGIFIVLAVAAVGIAAVLGHGMIGASLISVIWLACDYSRGDLHI